MKAKYLLATSKEKSRITNGLRPNSYAVGSVDRKGRFPIQDQIVHSYAVEKAPFRSQLFRSSNPIRASRRKVDFFNGTRGSDCSIEKVFQAHRIFHHLRKHTITPCNSSECWFDCHCCCCCRCCSQRVSVAHLVPRPAAARTVIRWQQCMISMTFSQHRCCCYARFGDSQRLPTPQPRR